MSAVIYISILAGVYGVFYYFNHKTPKPKGCENLKTECDGCKITSCMSHPVHDRVNEGGKKDANA